MSDSHDALTMSTGSRSYRWERQQQVKLALIAAALISVTVALPCRSALADAAQPNASHTLDSRLNQRMSVAWQRQQLRAAVQRLSESGHIAIWLDRRVDPRQRLQIEFEDTTLAEILRGLAGHCGLGTATLGEVVYLGPAQSARELATLAQQVRDQLEDVPAAVRRRWLQPAPRHLPKLTQPRRALADLFQQSGLKLDGSEAVPHDLWPEIELPPTSIVDTAVLMLIGFDLTIEIADRGRSARVVPIVRPLKLLPQNSDQVLRESLKNTAPPNSPDKRQVYSLRLKDQPVGSVVDQLAAKLGFDVEWNDQELTATKLSRDTLVSCDVTNVDAEELLRSVLSPAGLAHRRNGDVIEILPAKRAE